MLFSSWNILRFCALRIIASCYIERPKYDYRGHHYLQIHNSHGRGGRNKYTKSENRKGKRLREQKEREIPSFKYVSYLIAKV